MNQSFEVTRLKSGELTLKWVEGGEVFHPDIGALVESRLLIVDQLRLPDLFAAKDHRPLRIWDVGLGGAGNTATILESWKEAASRSLELISFDRSLEPLRLAWGAHQNNPADFPWLGSIQAPEILETGQVDFGAGESRAQWRFCLGDFAELMRKDPVPDLRAPDIILYDFFSPARNYGLWTLDHWKNVRRWLAGDRDTWIVFHSRSTALRVTLFLAGFYVGKGVALGNKEETTIACNRRPEGFKGFGPEWLSKVERSSASEPFVSSSYRSLAISEKWLSELRRHPQFSDALI